MGRLFDAGADLKQANEARAARAVIKQRADEVTKLLEEELHLDEESKKIWGRVDQMHTVQPIHYARFRRPGSRWEIEHAIAGPDYIYQLFPLKSPTVVWGDVITLCIAVMDAIFPQSVQIKYAPPNPSYKLEFYTIRVEKVTSLPGWENACKERALHGLAAVDAWPSR